MQIYRWNSSRRLHVQYSQIPGGRIVGAQRDTDRWKSESSPSRHTQTDSARSHENESCIDPQNTQRGGLNFLTLKSQRIDNVSLAKDIACFFHLTTNYTGDVSTSKGCALNVAVQRSSAIAILFAQAFRHLNLEIKMAQDSKEATAQPNKTIVPVGPGGTPGHLLRMIIMMCTGGFVYPNTFVEGMDLTAIQKQHQEPADKKQK